MRKIISLFLAFVGLMLIGCIPLKEDADVSGSEPIPLERDSNIVAYKKQLQSRLHSRYNNTPGYVGKIAYVDLVHAKPPRKSLDNQEVQVEFAQIVFDKWGERIPALEKEYYVITFGTGTPKLVRTEPSIKTGLKLEGGYGEYSEVSGGRLGRMLPSRSGRQATRTLQGVEYGQLQAPKMGETPVLAPQPDDLMPSTEISLEEMPQFDAMQPAAGEKLHRSEVSGVPNWLDEALQ